MQCWKRTERPPVGTLAPCSMREMSDSTAAANGFSVRRSFPLPETPTSAADAYRTGISLLTTTETGIGG